jgi:alpha-1,2-mannosyltransferase
MVTGVNEAADTRAPDTRSSRSRLLIAGVAAFAAVIASWVIFDILTGANGGTHAVDLTVYRDGGLIVRGVRPYFDPHASAPLYDWGGYSALALKFTYTPFAAIAFALLSFLQPGPLLGFSIIVNMLALPVALWFTFGGLAERDARYRDWRLRLGVTLLAAAVTFWLQPEIRTIYLGQVNLVLMAMIMWDMCQPSEGRWWKGFLTGVAAGIKLTPLIFVPYLLVTRKFREAAVTVAGFLFTVVVGFIILPGDSDQWWLHGLVYKDGTRAGFIGWAGNQSLRAIITRLTGSVAAGQTPWLIAVVVATVIGIGAAYLFERAGHHVVAVLVTALTALLDSPISWDHHWVWVAPGVAVAGHYAITGWKTARARARWLLALAIAMIIVFGPWPDAIWEKARNLGKFSLGFLWAPPNTNPQLYAIHGDQPSFVEYHWHGLQLLTGNAYILAGMALLLVLAAIAYRLRHESASSRTMPQTATPARIVSG